MHREELVVEIVADEIALGPRQLRAHDEREDAGKDEEQQSRADVPQAHIGVVDRRDDREALRGFPRLLEHLEFFRRARRRIGQLRRPAIQPLRAAVQIHRRLST
jgi:hypothetical protein